MKNSFRMMASSMSSQLLRPHLLMLLLVLVLVGRAACNVDCDPSDVKDMVSNGQVNAMRTASRGIKAALIHRDHHSLRRSTPRFTAEADEGHSSANSPASSPVSQGENWDPKLTFDSTDYEYVMNISLGTPPQTFVVIADTGSDLNWVQCLPLENGYNATDAPFDPSKSSTYAKLSCASSTCEFLSHSMETCDSGENCPWECEYSSSAPDGSDCFFYYTYGIGGTNGTLAEDTIHIHGVEGRFESVPKFSFGCTHNSTDQGIADGLFGLGRGNISFPSQLGQYFGRVFSYCLVDSFHRKSETSLLIFGDDALSPTAANGSRLQLQFTPLLDADLYYVDVEGISVNGVDVSIPKEAFAIDESGNGGTVFDSGTIITRLVSEAFDPLVEALKSAITQYEPLNSNDSLTLTGYELCYNASWNTWVKEYGLTIPTVNFNLAKNVTFNLGVRNFWDPSEAEGIICMAIFREELNAGVNNIFGNWQQADHYIVYDLQNQRIGFAPANCLKLKDQRS